MSNPPSLQHEFGSPGGLPPPPRIPPEKAFGPMKKSKKMYENQPSNIAIENKYRQSYHYTTRIWQFLFVELPTEYRSKLPKRKKLKVDFLYVTEI